MRRPVAWSWQPSRILQSPVQVQCLAVVRQHAAGQVGDLNEFVPYGRQSVVAQSGASKLTGSVEPSVLRYPQTLVELPLLPNVHVARTLRCYLQHPVQRLPLPRCGP